MSADDERHGAESSTTVTADAPLDMIPCQPGKGLRYPLQRRLAQAHGKLAHGKLEPGMAQRCPMRRKRVVEQPLGARLAHSVAALHASGMVLVAALTAAAPAAAGDVAAVAGGVAAVAGVVADDAGAVAGAAAGQA